MNNEKNLSFKQTWIIALEGISQELPATLSSLFFLCFSLSSFQFVFTYAPLLLNPGPLDENVLLTQRVLEGIWGFILTIIYSLIIPYAIYGHKGHYKNLSLMGFINKHVKLVSIETLRTLPIIIISFLLLVIPAFVKMIRLVFVPYVVVLSRRYHLGKVDALKESDRLTQGSFAGLASFYYISQIIVLAVVMGLPAILERLIGYEPRSLQNLLVDFIFSVPVAVVVELASAIGLIKIFERLIVLKEGPNELAF